MCISAIESIYDVNNSEVVISTGMKSGSVKSFTLDCLQNEYITRVLVFVKDNVYFCISLNFISIQISSVLCSIALKTNLNRDFSVICNNNEPVTKLVTKSNARLLGITKFAFVIHFRIFLSHNE